MKNPVKDWMQRPLRYWYIDGLSEIAAGLLFILIALLYFSTTLFPDDSSAANWLLGIGQPLLIIAAGLGLRKIVRALKERITYPRTGYVEYRQPRGSRRWQRGVITGLVAGVVAALTALLAGSLQANLMPALIGGMLALYLVFMARSYGVPRLYINAALTLVLGLGVMLANPSENMLMVWFMGFFGIIWMASGAITFAHYLSCTQPAEEGEE